MLARIDRFRTSLEESAAERRVPLPFGIGLFCDSLPNVYDLNYLRVDRPATGNEVLAAAEEAMAGFVHRKVELGPDLPAGAGARLAAELARAGWEQTTHLVMAQRRAPDRPLAAATIREVGFAQIEPVRSALILTEPWGSPRLAAELNAARWRIGQAVPLRYFAGFDGERLVAYCELREAGGVAQIEDVNVVPEARGRGHGRALVQFVAAEAARDNDVVFLEALAHDWPRHLYRSLGFDALAERHLLLRRPLAHGPGTVLDRAAGRRG